MQLPGLIAKHKQSGLVGWNDVPVQFTAALVSEGSPRFARDDVVLFYWYSVCYLRRHCEEQKGRPCAQAFRGNPFAINGSRYI